MLTRAMDITKEVPFITTGFEQQYLEVRERELHHYTNEQVAFLPDIESAHPHYKEWQIRKRSYIRLVDHLKKKRKHLDILEVGCGNGWLSAKMVTIDNTTVTGTDINVTELNQAKAVFGNTPNLQFACSDIRDKALADEQYDVIVFAASISYLPSLQDILNVALKLLTENGEIHIIDSPLYNDENVANARQRTKDYYVAMGLPEMTNLYFHHTIKELASFKYKTLYNPFSISNKLLRRRHPFYWICVSN